MGFGADHEKAQKMYDDDPLLFANEASDYGWSVITGMCGGCGEEKCHEGRPCIGAYCRLCAHRRAQGFPSDLDGVAPEC